MLFACISIIFTVAIILTVLLYMKWRYSYWKRRNVPQLSPSLPFGDMENPFTRKHGFGELIGIFYRKFKQSGEKHAGVYVFASPNYLPIEPELIKNIMRKDFQHFVDRGFYSNEKDDPLSANLFSIGGQKWKNLRAKLTPTFTSGKMKMMFDTLVECTRPIEERMARYFVKKEAVDIRDVLSHFTADVIASCAFGLECNDKFLAHGRNVLAPRGKAETLKVMFATALPKMANKLGIIFLPKESTVFFFNVVKDTIKYRRENEVQRNDMLQILMELQESDLNALTIEEIAAQVLMFFLAGFETSSATMTFCLYELAIHADLQEKVRKEINHVLKQHGGKLTYNAINEMKYMTQVIDETLRKYPPLTFITRQCIKDYLEPSSGVTIEKGTNVQISAWGLHMDPDYFPDPEKFDPERFSEENKHKIVPFSYIPFGEGPRHCIGMRFGMMQTKIALMCLLKSYLFTVSPETEIPLKLNKYSLFLAPENTIWLNIDQVC